MLFFTEPDDSMTSSDGMRTSLKGLSSANSLCQDSRGYQVRSRSILLMGYRWMSDGLPVVTTTSLLVHRWITGDHCWK